MDDLFSVAQNQFNTTVQQNTGMPMQRNMGYGQNMPMQGVGMFNQGVPMQGAGMYGQDMGMGLYGQSNPYIMQQMYQQPMGSMDRYGNIKYSKGEYLDGLRNYVLRCCNYKVAINREERIEDTPQKLRHCCAESKTKICALDKLSFDVPETNMHIPFYFCADCGKLYYYKDFMM